MANIADHTKVSQVTSKVPPAELIRRVRCGMVWSRGQYMRLVFLPVAEQRYYSLYLLTASPSASVPEPGVDESSLREPLLVVLVVDLLVARGWLYGPCDTVNHARIYTERHAQEERERGKGRREHTTKG